MRRSLIVLAVVALGLLPLPAHADLLSSSPSQAAVTSYFNWADHASRGMNNDNIHLLNPLGVAQSGTITIPGRWNASFSVPAGGEIYVPVPQGVIGGPVMVQVSAGGSGVIASQRVTYMNTLAEIQALRPQDALSDGWFVWYDLASPGMNIDNIHVLNPGSAASSGHITVGGQTINFSVGANGESYVNFPRGTIGGPVHFHVDSGPAVIVSQRVTYEQSFNEVLAMDPAKASTDSWFTWYDQTAPYMLVDTIHILNVGSQQSVGQVTIPGLQAKTFSITPGGYAILNWPGQLEGPVHVQVTSGSPVLASQRLSMPPTFQEWYGRPTAAAATEHWFNWYDDASPGFLDDVHVTNPGSTAANVTLHLGNLPAVTMQVAAGGDKFYTYPRGTIGGPLKVISDQPVLSSQRAFIVSPPPAPTSNTIGNVTYYSQSHRLSCEAAALEMALSHEGLYPSQDDILSRMHPDGTSAWCDAWGNMHWTDPYSNFVGNPDGYETYYTGYGAYYPVVASVAQSYGAHVLRAGEGVAPADIYNAVLAGHPVVAWVGFTGSSYVVKSPSSYQASDGRWVMFGHGFEHAVTVVGVNDSSVLVYNPWGSAGPVWMSKSSFESYYADFNDMAVVLS